MKQNNYGGFFMENKALNNRLIIISIFVFLFFSALTLKLVNVQIINKDKYKKSLDDIKVDEFNLQTICDKLNHIRKVAF